jgi:hypothetical protein
METRFNFTLRKEGTIQPLRAASGATVQQTPESIARPRRPGFGMDPGTIGSVPREMTETSDFIDHYEILEISPNANSGSIERMFRYLAQRYHPDNPESGNRDRFDQVLEANATLKDPARRAQYDVRYKQQSGMRSKLAEEAGDREGIDRDAELQKKLLSVFYVKRRHSVSDAGVSEYELERLLDCPIEHLEFHLWYLKAKGWIERLDTGKLAITIDGIDRATGEHRDKITKKLLTDQHV